MTTRESLVGLVERLREVTQADREAAADLIWPGERDGSIPAIEAWHRVRKGDDDGHRFVQAFARHRATALEEQSRRVEDLEAALQPFVDLGPQRGAWGVISKKLDGLAPLTVTVTKAQMLSALSALSPSKTVKKGEGE